MRIGKDVEHRMQTGLYANATDKYFPQNLIAIRLLKTAQPSRAVIS